MPRVPAAPRCAHELGYDAEFPCLRLLPIENKLKTQALMECGGA